MKFSQSVANHVKLSNGDTASIDYDPSFGDWMGYVSSKPGMFFSDKTPQKVIERMENLLAEVEQLKESF